MLRLQTESSQLLSILQKLQRLSWCSVTVKRFVRFETGEGLEKKNEDFAAEVAAQLQ